MAQVLAVTPIQHGVGNGEVKKFAVGDELTESDFSEQELRDFIVGGSAVEIGSDRKYSVPPDPAVDPGAADSETRLRDELIAKSLMADSPSPADQPAAADAISSASPMAQGNADPTAPPAPVEDRQTIGQAAAEANAEPDNSGKDAADAAANREG